MMKKILFITVFMTAALASAQIEYKGVVKDSIGTPLEMANVIALDTVAKRIASYGFTDSKGNFKLELKANTAYNIKISYIAVSYTHLTLPTNDLV